MSASNSSAVQPAANAADPPIGADAPEAKGAAAAAQPPPIVPPHADHSDEEKEISFRRALEELQKREQEWMDHDALLHEQMEDELMKPDDERDDEAIAEFEAAIAKYTRLLKNLRMAITRRKEQARQQADLLAEARGLSLTGALNAQSSSVSSAAAAFPFPATALSAKPITIPSNLPVWDASKYTAEEFIRQLIVVLDTARIPQDHYTKMLRFACKDNASIDGWIDETIIKPALTWEQGRDVWLKRFKRRDHRTELELEYKTMAQGSEPTNPNEDVLTYSNRFENICKKLGYMDDSDHVIAHFRDGLKKKPRKRVMKWLAKATLEAETKGDVAYQRALDAKKHSLKEYIALCIMLDANHRTIELGLRNPTRDRVSERKGDDDDSGGWQQVPHKNQNKKPLPPPRPQPLCKFHPNSTTHKTADCRENPKNKGGAPADAAQTHRPGAAGTGLTSAPRSGVRCFKCGAEGRKVGDGHSCVAGNRDGGPPGSGAPGPRPAAPANAPPNSSSTAAGAAGHNNAAGQGKSHQANVSSKRVLIDVDGYDRSLPPEVLSGDVHEHMTKLLSLPSTQHAAKKKLEPMVTLTIDGVKHLAALDSMSSHSLIDKAFVEEHGILFEPAEGEVELASAEHKAKRIGYTKTPLTVSLDPPGITIQHTFEVFPLRTAGYPHSFLLGRDLQEKFFRNKSGDALVLPLIPLPVEKPGSDAELAAAPPWPPKSNAITDPWGDDEISVEFEEGPRNKVKLFTPDNLEAEYAHGREKVFAVIRDALEENSKITGFCNLPDSVVTLRLKPGGEDHLYQKQYPLAHALVEKARPRIEKWRVAGRIVPAPAGCRFNNPVTIQPKKDAEGKFGVEVRVCFDGRRLNQWLETNDKYPIPIINDLLQSLAGHRIYGQFDLEDAYLQFMLTPESQEYTAFTFDGEQWMFCGAVYGIKPLAGHLQRIVSRLLRDLSFVRVYFDNTPFASDSWEEHAEHALTILRRFNAANLKVKQSAVMIGHAVMSVLGHAISRDGVAISSDKMDCVASWEPPKTGADMSRFIGVIGFLGHHVRHFGELTAPFHPLKQLKTKEIDWTPELLERFETLKEAIQRAPTLTAPDYSRPFHLAVDASNSGIGGVLYQPAEIDGDITPDNIVRIFSKKLNPTQVRYPAYKKELFALVSCLRKFHSYLWGREDTVLITDHNPLTYIMEQEQMTPTVQQWLDVLCDYKFKIRYRPGVLNVAPDALSRMYRATYADAPKWGVAPIPTNPNESIQWTEFSQENDGRTTLSAWPKRKLISVRMLSVSTRSATRQRRQQEWSQQNAAIIASALTAPSSSAAASASPISSTAAAAVQPTGGGNAAAPLDSTPREEKSQQRATLVTEEKRDSSASDDESAESAARPRHSPPAMIDPASPENRDALLVAMELRGAHAPESKEERQRLIKNEHALGDFGREAIFKKLVSKNIWWPGMRADIEEEIKQCDGCLRNTVVKRGWHPASFVMSTVPWDHIQIDTATNLPESIDGMTVLLVVVDVCSGFVVLRALPDKEMETVARALWSIFALLGLPRIMQSDNGTEFVNKIVEAIVRISGIDHRTISEWNPAADGKVERTVGIVKTVILKRLHGYDRLWSFYVDYAQLSINVKIAELTNTSPFVIMFARQLNELRDRTTDPPTKVDLQEWREHQDKVASLILPALGERVLAAKQKQVEYLNKIRRQLTPDALPSGSTVMVKNVYRSGKFDDRYLGPYTIERRSRSGAYVLRDAMGDILDRRVPVDQIKVVSPGALARDEQAPHYYVDKILEHRGEPGKYEFLVAWTGYDEPTWEPEENFSQRVLQRYWASVQPQQPARRNRRRAAAAADQQ